MLKMYMQLLFVCYMVVWRWKCACHCFYMAKSCWRIFEYICMTFLQVSLLMCRRFLCISFFSYVRAVYSVHQRILQAVLTLSKIVILSHFWSYGWKWPLPASIYFLNLIGKLRTALFSGPMASCPISSPVWETVLALHGAFKKVQA